MSDADDLREAVHQARTAPTADQLYTRLQHDRAASGLAAGQCPSCGSYRADGQPPILHREGCDRG